MGLGLQNVQELTGYIEEMFSEYMTFPTALFIVAIVVALSSIACFILAPFYIKGKARGAKTAAQVISVIDFIIGILLILAFIIITLLFNMASDGFFDSADEFLKAVLGFLIAPTRFGMSLEEFSELMQISARLYCFMPCILLRQACSDWPHLS